MSQQTFHAYVEQNPGLDACQDCGAPRGHACHPQPTIPLSNASMAIGQLVVARQHLRAAAEMINVGGPTAGAIVSNLYQRVNSLDSIEACLIQARDVAGGINDIDDQR